MFPFESHRRLRSHSPPPTGGYAGSVLDLESQKQRLLQGYQIEHGKRQSQHSSSRICRFNSAGFVVCMVALAIWLPLEAVWFRSSRLSRLSDDPNCPVTEWKYPDCRHLQGGPIKSVPTPDDWLRMRKAYRKVYIDLGRFEDFPFDEDWVNGNETGFLVPIEVKWAKERGRGLYYAGDKPVTKGTVMGENKYTAHFHDECSARVFLTSLPNDDACQAILWGYLNNDQGQSPTKWSVDLDPNSFLNHRTAPETSNVEDVHQMHLPFDKPGSYQMVASRDIQPGEELLSNYDFVIAFSSDPGMWWHLRFFIHSWGVSIW